MPKHDTNHFHAVLDGSPNFFMVADLVHRSLNARGVPCDLVFYRNRDMFGLLFRIHTGTKQQGALSIRCHPLEAGGELQNLAVHEITGPLDDDTLPTVHGMMSRFGARWSVRDYYTADLLEKKKVSKIKSEQYVPTDTIRAMVELADIVPFDEISNYIHLLKDRQKSAAVAEVIDRYGPAVAAESHPAAEEGPRP